MSFALYMDVHVPAAITQGLRRRGVDVLTSQDDGTRRASDEELLERATELGRVFFSQDEDLLAVVAEWQRIGRPFTGLIFAAQQRTTIGQCLEDLELVARCGVAEKRLPIG